MDQLGLRLVRLLRLLNDCGITFIYMLQDYLKVMTVELPSVLRNNLPNYFVLLLRYVLKSYLDIILGSLL